MWIARSIGGARDAPSTTRAQDWAPERAKTPLHGSRLPGAGPQLRERLICGILVHLAPLRGPASRTPGFDFSRILVYSDTVPVLLVSTRVRADSAGVETDIVASITATGDAPCTALDKTYRMDTAFLAYT